MKLRIDESAVGLRLDLDEAQRLLSVGRQQWELPFPPQSLKVSIECVSTPSQGAPEDSPTGVDSPRTPTATDAPTATSGTLTGAWGFLDPEQSCAGLRVQVQGAALELLLEKVSSNPLSGASPKRSKRDLEIVGYWIHAQSQQAMPLKFEVDCMPPKQANRQRDLSPTEFQVI